MKLIRTRDDLLDLIADAAPTKAAETAIRSRQGVRFMGGFVSSAGYPGWVVELDLHGRVWYLALWVDEIGRRYLTQELKALPTGRIPCPLDP